MAPMDVDLRAPGPEELGKFLNATENSFGYTAEDDDVEHFRHLLHVERALVCVDGGDFVGTTAAFSMSLAVPGGRLPAAGVTMVGVLPSHRRAGLLTRMMRRQIDDVKERGEPLAILWASEAGIYQRYGYGLASVHLALDIDRNRARFVSDPGRVGMCRMVDPRAALDDLTAVYDRALEKTPGMFARSPAWWEHHVLPDPERDRDGGGPRFCAVWENAGEPGGYVFYRTHAGWAEGLPSGYVSVLETAAPTVTATREIWRFLFGLDLAARIKAHWQPADSPLMLMVEEPRRLRAVASDNLWLRIVDIAGALEGRGYAADGSLVVRITDRFCPWNDGTWRLDVDTGKARLVATNSDPELHLTIADLAAAYLGAFTFADLRRAGRVEEQSAGAVERADKLFVTIRRPFCPEIF